MDQGKTNLLNMFRKTLKNAPNDRLNRSIEGYAPERVSINLKKRITSPIKNLDGGKKITCHLNKKPGYSINLSEPNKNDAIEEKVEKIHISPVEIRFSVSWDVWKRTTGIWPINHNKCKLVEIQEYMSQYGLKTSHLHCESSWGDSWRDSVRQTKLTYAIFYGNYVRELTDQEYGDLVHEYLERICEIDTEKINKTLEEE